MQDNGLTVCWFSAGAASAYAAALTLVDPPTEHVVVARIHLPEEDEDNVRFANDFASLFGVTIVTLRSGVYASCEDLWNRRRFMSGPNGAICTTEMKRAVRHAYEREMNPTRQTFGFTAEETKRVDRMRLEEPWIGLHTPLVTAGISKTDCFAWLREIGLRPPRIYAMGYPNANCVGCVKAQSPNYWNRVRRTHPEVFARRAALSRELGVRLVKLGGGSRPRLFLDELDPKARTRAKEPTWDCGISCPVGGRA